MSILLDTNVLSEILRAQPSPPVLRWMSARPSQSLGVTSITHAEMLLGARLLPPGKRRVRLEAALEAMFEEDFGERVHPFDRAAVPAYVHIVSRRRAAGRTISQFDAQIAAIALRRGDRLATRNLSDFDDCGLTLIDPWRFAG